MMKVWIVSLLIIAIAVIAYILVSPILSRVEKPNYDIISSHQTIEIRQYAPMIIAEVSVTGQRKTAIREGFRLLADYIFGNNTVQQKIAMTAPVQQQDSKKIAMTAPVQQRSDNGQWKISFVMPSQYSMTTIPKPNNKKVMLIAIPSKRYVVIEFSGLASDSNIATHENELTQYLTKHQIQPLSKATYAFYNPPWTLPFMRRNEIMIEIESLD